MGCPTPFAAVGGSLTEGSAAAVSAGATGKNKRGGRTAVSAAGKARLFIKRSDPLGGPSATLVEMEWDKTDEMGQVMERELYAYDLVAWDTVPGSGGDMNQKVSSHLFIDVATDEEGNPILEAEYAGYDDGGTPEDESDDNHLYYIRRYQLREVPVPLDNDGDLFENEDWVDGVDNDEDGAVDEDPEDYQPMRGASEGVIRLYDPDLQKVGEWTIPSLPCIEHNANDGLRTSAEGMQHSLFIKVPVALMLKEDGDDRRYRFVIATQDSHGDREKGHFPSHLQLPLLQTFMFSGSPFFPICFLLLRHRGGD